MTLRAFLPTALLASLAASASAITFTTSGVTSFQFTLPTGVTLATVTSSFKDTSNTGDGMSTSDVVFGGNGTDLYTVTTSASGSAFTNGTASATASGNYVFNFKNTTNKIVEIKFHQTYDLTSTLAGTGTGTPFGFADTTIASTGFSDGSDFAYVETYDTDTSSNAFDGSFFMGKNSVFSFTHSSSSNGYVQTVPEPASLAALGLGAAALLRRRRR